MGFLAAIKKIFQPSHKEKDNNSPALQDDAPPAEVYRAGIEAQRAEKDHFFKHSPYSPFTERSNFSGLNYYPPNPAFRYELPLQKVDDPNLLTLQTNTGDEQNFHRLGTVSFEVDGETAQLAVYRSVDHGGLFVPFRDATSGHETYGAGRYLEPEAWGNDILLVDFNLAYNPYCAYSQDYSCPLPPFENHLTTVSIRAGEKAYKTNDSPL